MEANIDNKNIGDKKLNFKDIVTTIVGGVAIAIVAMIFIAPVVVDGSSMNPTLKDGQRLVLNKLAYKFGEPKYKDVIVVKRNDLSVKYLIKRVIAVGGDHLEIKDNKVYVNGELLVEDYINNSESMKTDDLDITIPDGKVFVMGDNRNHSVDSRSAVIGLIDVKTQITGKLFGNR